MEKQFDTAEKLKEVKQLMKNVSDASNYETRMQLQSIDQLLQSLRDQHEKNNKFSHTLIGMLGTVQFQLGDIAFDCEQHSIAENHYNQAESIISDCIYEREVVSVAVSLFNRIGILNNTLNNAEKAKIYLHKADEIYQKVKTSKIMPIHYLALFEYCDETEPDAMLKFEQCHTQTVLHLAHSYLQTDKLQSSLFAHETLQREYDYKQFEHIDWAINTASLSQYFMQHNGFQQARHHLSASLFMLDEYKAELDEAVTDDEEHAANIETFNRTLADVARCFIKYGINLLENSKERLRNTEDIAVTASNCTDFTRMPEYQAQIGDRSLQFENIDLASYESQVSDQFVLTFDDAKEVFAFCARWVQIAQDYHTLETHASDYLAIGFDYSNLYALLAFYVDDEEMQCRYLKRGMDVLEKPLESVNPTYYMQDCRHNWEQIASLALTMYHLKMVKFKSGAVKMTMHAKQKIHMLVAKSAVYSSKFIDSFRNADGAFPKTVPEPYQTEFLNAYFLRASLWPRIICDSSNVIVDNIRKSIHDYEAIIDYVKANETVLESVKLEYDIAVETVPLLKHKIAKLEREASVLLRKNE